MRKIIPIAAFVLLTIFALKLLPFTIMTSKIESYVKDRYDRVVTDAEGIEVFPSVEDSNSTPYWNNSVTAYLDHTEKKFLGIITDSHVLRAFCSENIWITQYSTVTDAISAFEMRKKETYNAERTKRVALAANGYELYEGHCFYDESSDTVCFVQRMDPFISIAAHKRTGDIVVSYFVHNAHVEDITEDIISDLDILGIDLPEEALKAS